MGRLRVCFWRHQGRSNSRENNCAVDSLRQGGGAMQPKPFYQRSEGRGEALDQYDGAARANARIRLEHGKIADAKPDTTAEKQDWKRRTAQAESKQVGQ